MDSSTIRLSAGLLVVLILNSVTHADEKELPRPLDKRLKIELFAENPTIVTPTGIDVDHQGRVWAIESNTHFPPDGYKGHSSDRVWVMDDTDGDGNSDKVVEFTDGLTHTMSIAVRPIWLRSVASKDQKGKKQNEKAGAEGAVSAGDVYIATRRAIFVYSDDDGDLKADRHNTIVHLETAGNYPHNGLAGFAFDAMGWMYFGFGENLGADYKIIGSDGTSLSGGGEGGHIYRCRPDGSDLKEWAKGFWNPHANCVDAFGRLFSVDNDPDSRPPCRLLHIIKGGDYGFRFSNGRKGLHPFTAWNGEIPGTLPMVAGTGEAPSGIVAYESDGLPSEYVGNLLVTSWGDHRIDRFRLKPKGASFESLAETVIQGGEDFRPVGIAVAPDGSLFCTDWVKRDYKLHGHGRVWRISMKEEPKRKVVDVAAISKEMKADELNQLLESPRMEVRRMAAVRLSLTAEGRRTLIKSFGNDSQSTRSAVEVFWGMAGVPFETQNFHLFDKSEEEPKCRTKEDELYSAIGWLLGTPQLNSEILGDRDLLSALLFEYGSDELLSWIRGEKDFDDSAFIYSVLQYCRFDLNGENQLKLIDSAFQIPNRFHFAMLVDVLSKSINTEKVNELFKKQQLKNSESRHGFLLAARKSDAKNVLPLKIALNDSSASVRRAAVQWVAEENLKELRPQVEAILNDSSKSMTTDLFLATLAALEMLDGIKPQDFDKTPASKYVLPIVKDKKRSPSVRAQALRLVDPNEKELTPNLLEDLLFSPDAGLRLEAVRTLQLRRGKESAALLSSVVKDEKSDLNLRAEAVAGLAINLQDKELGTAAKQQLLEILKGRNGRLQLEAVRALRPVVTTDETIKKAIVEVSKNPGWKQPKFSEQIEMALKGTSEVEHRQSLADKNDSGDAVAGRRVFFHVNSAGCYKCHTVNGRGGKIGPDLSIIARTMNRKKLAESILQPSKEISPQFSLWTFVMESGQVHHGMILGDTRNKVQQIGTAEGKVVELPAIEIEERILQTKSLMPEKLVERLTPTEFRDLLAYLETLK